MPTDPIFLSPSIGFTDILQVASVMPYPSVIFIPVDDSNFLNSSTGNARERAKSGSPNRFAAPTTSAYHE